MVNHCVDCGTEISARSTRCKACSNTYRWQGWLVTGAALEVKNKIAAGVSQAWSRGDFECSRRAHLNVGGIEGKVCSTCQEWKPLDGFYVESRAWDKRDYMCRACRWARRADKYRRAGNRCIDCGRYIDYRAVRCVECDIASRRIEHEIRGGIAGNTCFKCGEWKPLTDYYRNASSWDGLTCRCGQCLSLQVRLSRLAQHSHCVDCGAAISVRATWCPQCLAKRRRNVHTAIQGVMGKVCSTCQEWKPLGEFCKGDRWDELSHRCRACRTERAEERRARIAGVDIDEIDVEAIFARDRYRCTYCGNIENLSIDHIIPLASRGAHCEDNLVTACRSCNSSKGAKSLIAWMLHGGWWQLQQGVNYGTQGKEISYGGMA